MSRLLLRLRLFIKGLMPNTLFARSLLILIVPVILTQGIATFIFFDRHWDNMTKRLAQAIAGETALVAEYFESDLSTKEGRALISITARKLNLLVGFERDATSLPDYHRGDVWDSSVAHRLDEEMKKSVERDYVITMLDDKNLQMSVLLNNGLLQIVIPEKRLFSSTAYIFLLWMIGSSLLLMGIAIIFMRNQIKPIRQLARAADRLGRGLEIAPLKEYGAREIRQATSAFEIMRDRIQRQIDQRTTMLAGVSHDLRTPLTRMKLALEMMQQDNDVVALKGDLDDMEEMIEGYLAFVRGDEETSPTYVDLSSLIQSITDKKLADSKTMHAAIQKSIFVTIRPEAIKRAIANLISNALTHADDVWVRLYRIGETIEIIVEDNGAGIADEKMEEVFKPFYRIDESRNRKTGGVGLGLSIVKDIINSHGGHIFLEKSTRGGLRVVIHLP